MSHADGSDVGGHQPSLRSGSEEDSAPKSAFQFHVDASVVFQLGESLVSDVIQAVVELIKNAYDADATWVRVVVDTGPEGDDSASGLILIEDNGVGMTEDEIKKGWLYISRSPKRTLKNNLGTTKRGRTPLGDKGLGRLGVQRLGDRVEIVTRAAGTDGMATQEHVVSFSWQDFRTAATVEEVPVEAETRPASSLASGTRITISQLRDTATWRTKEARAHLQDELSQMLSPYATIADFKAVVIVNGDRIDLAELDQKVRDAARVHYEVNFDGHTLTVRGYVKQAFFRPPPGPDREEYGRLVESDQGQALASYLVETLRAARGSEERPVQYLRPSDSPKWFLEFGKDVSLDNLPHLPRSSNRNPVNPGPFTAEIDSFDLGPEAMRDIEEQDVFSSRGHFKTYLKSIHGVRVYRDGFGIRVDRDWLNLGRTATSGASYYSLRPKNTIGYVALSARANSQLEEKTDREGFKITPAYTTFVRLLDEFVKFSDQAQGLLRRNYLSFCRSHNVKLANVEVGTTPEELAEDVREGVAEIHGSLPALESVAAAVRAMENINALVNTISGLSESLPKSLVTRLNEYWAVVRSSATRARESLAAIQATIGNAERLLPKSQILAAEVQSFRERTADVFELASLGLTAEALSHEIQNISDQLRGRARRATDYIRRESVIDSELLGFAEYVGSSVDALRKQLGHLEPSLRFARDKREEISILEFLRSLSDFYRARLDARGIAMEVTAEGSGTFKVMMSRGKLTQVFDNLILNSEYWLGADLEAEEINTGAIHLVVDAPHVRISDSGRGVAPDLELSLFEPFVSGKARGRGRGLGLYIVKQLLEADGCAISLLPSRNERERRFVFDIDFTGTLASATP